jgi:fused signal recognition particle receptor
VETLQIILVIAALVVVAGLGWYLARRRGTAGEVVDRPVPEARRPGARPGTKLADRLSRTSESLGGALRGVFARGTLDTEFWEGMEEALVGADIGVAAAGEIMAGVRDARPEDAASARMLLRSQLIDEMGDRPRQLMLGNTKPAVVMVVGVNGAGKTTSIAKLARLMQVEGRVPLLGAADTFRAAAEAQLRTWGDRLGVDVVGGQEGADPAAVAFDAVAAARSRGRDVVFVDTAGRLQSKHNLMAELTKIRRVLERDADPVDEVLLVLDATAGQNGIAQVEEFARAVGVTGIVLTKLDGTARGGVVVAVERSLGVPVKYIGVGEGMDDLLPFEPADFVEALLADA